MCAVQLIQSEKRKSFEMPQSDNFLFSWYEKFKAIKMQFFITACTIFLLIDGSRWPYWLHHQRYHNNFM
jgi:hypothetical protein